MGSSPHPYLRTAMSDGEGHAWTFGADESGTEVAVDGVTFVLGYLPTTSADRFYLLKPRPLLERYRELRDVVEHGNVVELGIAEGGSTAWMALELGPAKLIAVDIAPDRLAALDDLIAARDLGDVVRPYWGVDQSDRDRLRSIVDDELGAQPLDVVIDDASHLLDPSRASFETLFPRLRPGGLYVIEDWSWEHRGADMWSAYFNDPDAPDREARQALLAERLLQAENWPAPLEPLSALAFELTLACARSGDAVAEVTVNESWIVVRRGPAALDPVSFRLADRYEDHFSQLGRSSAPSVIDPS
jgi:predicted O-methyltransferase YrrM